MKRDRDRRELKCGQHVTRSPGAIRSPPAVQTSKNLPSVLNLPAYHALFQILHFGDEPRSPTAISPSSLPLSGNAAAINHSGDGSSLSSPLQYLLHP